MRRRLRGPTASDYLCFAMMLMNGGRAGEARLL
jgi:hypothetical protein